MINRKAGDTRPVDKVLTRGSGGIDLTGSTVDVYFSPQNGGDGISGSCEVLTGGETGACRFEPDVGFDVGLYYVEWRIDYPTGEREYVPNRGYETMKIERDLDPPP